MTVYPNDLAADAALSFVQSRIADQARRESMPLTSAELQQLVFTEETATEKEIAAAEAFDQENNQEEFEQKISSLLRHVYKRDVESGIKGEWERQLSALQHRDVYVLVMVEMAEIPREVDQLPVFTGMQLSSFFGDLSFADVRRKLTMPLLWLVFIFTSFFCFMGVLGAKRHEFPADQRSELRDFAERLVPSESARNTLILVWIGSGLILWWNSKKI
jgi:hypothetical protein